MSVGFGSRISNVPQMKDLRSFYISPEFAMISISLDIANIELTNNIHSWYIHLWTWDLRQKIATNSYIKCKKSLHAFFSNVLFKLISFPRSSSYCRCASNHSTRTSLHSTNIITRAFSVSSFKNRSRQQTYRRWHTSIANSQSLQVVRGWQERSEPLSMHISSIRQTTNWNLDLW